MPKSQSPLFIIIDGHSLAFRAYYALAKSKKGSLRTANGIPTSVCVGFLNSLFQVLETHQPELVAIAFDGQEATFRHQADINYKANRTESPEEFTEDLANLTDLLKGLNLKIVTASGYEADDVIATLTKQGIEKGYGVKIVTGDRDLFQLVDDRQEISILYLDRNLGNYTEFDSEAVINKLGVKPTQIVDYKALCGDKSDNIPGVRGVGEKTAVTLLQKYQTLENIYSCLEEIKGSLQNKLKEGRKNAQHSQYLAKLVDDISLNINLDDLKLVGFKENILIPKLQRLELKKFLSKLDKIQQQLGGKPEEFQLEKSASSQQLSLFPKSKQEKLIETQVQPKIIDTPQLLEELIANLKTKTNPQNPVAWDTETTSLSPRKSNLVGIGCCWGQNLTDIAYIPLHHNQGKQLDFLTVINALKPILENPSYPKAFQNAKFDRLVLLAQGIKLSGVTFDTMLASYVLQPEKSHKLSSLSQEYLANIVAKDYDSLNIPKGETIADLDIQKVAEYCGLDAYATFNLVEVLQKELNRIPDLKQVFQLEMQLEPILASMETNGIKIDREYLQKLSLNLEEKLIKIERQVYQEAGEKFNLASPKQLSELLFEKLGLDKRKSRKITTGYSTNHSVLEKLEGDHPVIEKILSYRTLAKLKSTYLDALPTLIDPKTQRLHTNYNQNVTATGRLSSSNPNLQNIPIRTEFSRQIRQAFIPQKDWLFLAADYSQIELRILAHLSQEPILLKAYHNHQDIHSVTAQLLFEKEQITPSERSLGKTINFGVIYGMGAQKFAREAKVTVKEAKNFITKYHQKYPQVFAYLETMKKEAIAHGFVRTILGRRRYFNFTQRNLQELRGVNPELINLEQLKLNNNDAQLLRSAANSPIQGSSADIIKMAMIKVAEILENYQAKLLLQVHDELVFELPVNELEELAAKIKQIMENVVDLTVPFQVDLNWGKNWMEAK
jgi:DNA polymerase-1